MSGKKKSRIRLLKAKIARLEAELNAVRNPPPWISPFAPPDGFPDLPNVRGMEYASMQAGIRYRNRSDVMLARAVAGSTLAAVFTKSATRSAPVRDCERKLASLAGRASSQGLAVIANSGNANAFTGQYGEDTVEEVSAEVGNALQISPSAVFTASTGVIGEPLPVPVIKGAVDGLVEGLDPAGIEGAAWAIMTTDSYPKGSGLTWSVDGHDFAISGIAKGSGMIAPDMATMLSFVFSDVSIEQRVLQDLVTATCGRTFNSVTVDGDTSTSDTLLVIATGAGGGPMIEDIDSKAGGRFAEALDLVMADLAKQVAKDGEGITKFVEVRVSGARSDSDAQLVARSIANSPLVKTAISGEDPNWGRVVMAVGKSGAEADRDHLSIGFGDLEVARDGQVSPLHSEELAAEYMKNDEIVVAADLGLGNGEARVWTCDFSRHYIEINADYRS